MRGHKWNIEPSAIGLRFACECGAHAFLTGDRTGVTLDPAHNEHPILHDVSLDGEEWELVEIEGLGDV